MITATYPPSANGVAIVVKNLKTELTKSGHEVMVLAPENNKGTKESGVIRFPSVQNPLVKDYPIPLFPGVRSIYKLITSFKPDIVHVHHPFHVGFFAKIIADQFEVPLVFTYHTRYDLYADKYATFLPSDLKRWFVENSIEKFCKKVDLILSPSKFIAKKIRQKNGHVRVKVVPNWNTQFKPTYKSKETLRKNLSIPNDKNILLTVCRLGKEKNVEVVIKSLKYLDSSYYLIIVGDGPDANRLKDLAGKYSLENRIRFVGKVAHNVVGKFYELSDIFVYPSITETQGLILLEAASYKLPIVAVNCEVNKEFLSKDSSILTRNDAKYMASDILNMTKINTTQIEKDQSEWIKNFTPKKLMVLLISAYGEVLSEK
jgi:1,2-diacylglycerol 3-alpha-glucosyltransferase